MGEIMNKKLYQIFIAFLLVGFSFYYTEKCVDFIKQKDPIMKEIVLKQESYKKVAVNALLKDDMITPGVNGKKIAINESYQKMKQYGKYNEALFVFSSVKPSISIDDYYEYYINGGNALINSVALVFKVDSTTYLDNILKTLKEQNVRATFFVDGKIIEEKQETVALIAKDFHEVEILSYDGLYDKLSFKDSLKTLEILNNVKGKYCYAEYDNKDVIDVCSKLKLHTIIPTILARHYPYNSIKTKLQKGSIIGFNINQTVDSELSTIISYINQKGYNMDTLDLVLSEALENNK